VSPTDINGDAIAIGVEIGNGVTGPIEQHPRVALRRQQAIESCSRSVSVRYVRQEVRLHAASSSRMGGPNKSGHDGKQEGAK
jgi:hypothetical protein